MKLISVKLEGYRRFLTPEKINIDCRLVAIIGPNEAGKTTLLRAFQALNHSEAFEIDGPSQDTTRGEKFEPTHKILTANYLLEKTDKEVLKNVKEAKDLRWVIEQKQVDGSFAYEYIPEILRNVSLRIKTLSRLRGIIGKIPDGDADDEAESNPLHNQISELLEEIKDEHVQDLAEGTIEKLRELAVTLTESEDKALLKTAKQISDLVASEKIAHPAEKVKDLLRPALSNFVLFTNEDRDLKSSYELTAFFREKDRIHIPNALTNLAETAALSLEGLFDAVQVDDQGTVDTLISRANKEIGSKISKAWNQSKIDVKFSLKGTRLHIIVGSLEAGFESIAERSDGLQQFVALFAFLSRTSKPKENVILLIDEAEMHLHYDAQADLVQMLAKQRLASKVIYTTHSIGCLPEDFGMGIRMVRPDEKKKGRSNIVNKFWSAQEPGMSPLLYGMGATTMAFLPVRYCVLTEGAADMILLPTLFREAVGCESLGFQIVQGLSQSSVGQIAILKREGRRVLFLVDGDDGGKALKKKLKKAGIEENEILKLEAPKNQPCTVEDFVDKSIYVSAINAELRRSGKANGIKVGDLPTTLRSKAVDAWCNRRHINIPSKVDVAYQVLEEIDGSRIIDRARSGRLKSLYEKIRASFEL